MAHTAATIGIPDLTVQDLAGTRLEESLGGAQRQRAVRGAELGISAEAERESAIRREQSRERRRRRRSELFSLAGTLAGFAIPGGPLLSAGRLLGASVGGRLGGFAGQIATGRRPGAAVSGLADVLGAVGGRQELREREARARRRRSQLTESFDEPFLGGS